MEKEIRVYRSRWSEKEQDTNYKFIQWLATEETVIAIVEDLLTGQIYSFKLSQYIMAFVPNTNSPLTVEKLKKYGFKKEVISNDDKRWIKHGITIYEDSWWLDETTGKSSYEEGEKTPEITFSYATYVKGDGSIKGGWTINSDQQLKDLWKALTQTELTEIEE